MSLWNRCQEDWEGDDIKNGKIFHRIGSFSYLLELLSVSLLPNPSPVGSEFTISPPPVRPEAEGWLR
jgi:hypothetical protein